MHPEILTRKPLAVDEILLDAEDDPVLLAFLDYLDQQIVVHPELIVAADYTQLERIAKLVEGVEFEDDWLVKCSNSYPN